MARKKPRPIRSGTPVSEVTDHQSSTVAELVMPDDLSSISGDDSNVMKPFFINIEPCSSLSDEHFDVAEITLGNIKCFDGITNNLQAEEICGEDSHSLRFCLLGFNKGSFRFGSLPSFSADNIQLEYVHNSASTKEAFIILSGQFDGPDESICGLVHLVSLKLLGLRLMLEAVKPPDNLSVRVRIEILRSAFDACKPPMEVKRQPWRRSMMNVMLWLRPEVATSEVIYGMGQENVTDGYKCDKSSSSGTKNYDEFDVTAFYEAIKPSKEEPVLEKEFPDLFPCLRPYQQRAVYWMFSREKGTPVGKFQHLSLAPFSIPIVFLGGQSTMFYNPFNGDVSWNPPPYSNVSGGILADEMGLGKTVELLACIFANFKQSADECITDNDFEDIRGQIKRQKIERVECICGAASESTKYEGVWVQCDICDAWQHADCVRDSPRKVPSFSLNMYKSSEKFQPVKSMSDRDRRGPSCDVDMEGDFVCYLCSELIEAASIKISTGATLIICPETIQAQWYSEIIRHTRPGSLKIYIYEGARSITTSAALNHIMHKLATADIVITTYTVLKEDLSHDSDRQDGDRRFLRFQKRYPVIPTLLTRIHWWRLCLDEAQMVERNTGSVTEMAMRLHAHHRWCITGTPIQHKLDDLFGLLRFLRASPFDTCRWWVQVVRDPYERKDKVAIEFVHKLFKQIMWRSSKIHVMEELQLPPQEVCLQWLILSPIEEHFYQKQHETCVRFAKEIITSNSHGREFISGPKCSSDSILSNDEVSKLLWPLLKLRQACCHPQVGSSGLCSLQKTPLAMEKILEILIGKSKIEGEEALRRITVALNGLAAVSLIEKDNERAVSIYKEALAITDENADDYRLDPLLNLHIHHNLAELLSLTSERICQCNGWQCSEMNARKSKFTGKYDQHYVKRQKNGMDHIPNLVINGESSEKHGILNSSIMNNNLHRDKAHDSEKDLPSRCFAVGCLRETCENIRQKYLSSYLSKLSSVQLEFKNCYNEVCSLFEECKVGMSWWVKVLDIIEKKKESSHELIKKIELAISKVHSNFRSLQVYSGFRNMKGLKYTIQVGLDSLQTCREALITPLLQIGQTVEKPDESVVARVRDCPYCSSGDGNFCLHCELDFLFQKYEAKLFLLRNTNDHDAIPSLGEALDHQKRKYELNSFFRNVNTYTGSSVDYKESKQRHAKENIEVLRHPSALEITLKVLSSYSKAILGRQDYALARKHLQLFEAMRKEFAQARLLSSSQAQLICAHDEIKLSTSRLRLQENDSEPTAINILKREDLIPCSMQFSTDKFVSLSLLSRMKGQLRYLKGLVAAKVEINQPIQFSPSHDKVGMHMVNSETSNECRRCLKIDDEPCPICHEKLESQKMVFECGHVLCCKCFLHLTDKAIFGSGKCQNKWLMCPTCRQRTDMEQVAYVDEKLNEHSNSRALQAFNAQDMNECAIAIRGSYGTKIEAVTRKILWITSTNRTAKILVFSSWNDVLDVLQHALDSNDITYVRMKGGRKSQVALSQFKGDIGSLEDIQLNKKFSKSKGFQVLLIPIHHGSNGLNLLEAQHVILVEPLLNPAVEAQAISRVHRIGQEKKTFVHRFIVRNTVEESIYKLNLSRSGSPVAGTKPSKNHDQPTLTLQDVKNLFPSLEAAESSEENLETVSVSEESLRHLPACVAAAVAAERRLMMDSQDNY